MAADDRDLAMDEERCPGSGQHATQATVYGQTGYVSHCSWCGYQVAARNGVTLFHTTDGVHDG